MLHTTTNKWDPSFERQHDEFVGQASVHQAPYKQCSHATCQNRNPNEACLVHCETFESQHMVSELQQQLLNATSRSQQAAAQLTTCQIQLQTAHDKNLDLQSCVRQHDKDIIDMKLELVQIRSRMRQAMIDQNALLGADARLTLYSLHLEQKEQELKNCENVLQQLDAEEEKLQTQVSRLKGELQSLTPQSFSASEKWQEAQKKLAENVRACSELRKSLSQQIAANEEFEDQQSMQAKGVSQVDILAGRRNNHGVMLQRPPPFLS